MRPLERKVFATSCHTNHIKKRLAALKLVSHLQDEQRQEHSDQRDAARQDPAVGHRAHDQLLPAGRGLRHRRGLPAHRRIRREAECAGET